MSPSKVFLIEVLILSIILCIFVAQISNMKTMSKKTIIIIGATSGIGRELFEKYAVDGNCIGIVGRRKNLLDELYKQHPDNTFTSAADITKQEEIEQAIHTLCAKLNNYMEALRKKAFKSGGHVTVTDIRPGLVDTAMAKGEGLFWVMPVDKVAHQIYAAIRGKKSKAYVTKRWHVLAVINKNLPFHLYRLL